MADDDFSDMYANTPGYDHAGVPTGKHPERNTQQKRRETDKKTCGLCKGDRGRYNDAGDWENCPQCQGYGYIVVPKKHTTWGW